MAPVRRRGTGRAAAAAAQTNWKVGDLVLAKMKGFPPWPAEITDPQKWGFSPHKKKILVYFFGTKQIAFCNHMDIEAFTEEKKKALLPKRQGKGADFVRALEEIIDSFDKSQKEKHNDQLVPFDDENLPELVNFKGSSSKPSVSPKSVVQANMQSEKNDGYKTDVSSPMEVDDHQELDVGEHANGNMPIIDELKLTSLRATAVKSRRKRPRDASPSTCVTQKRTSSLPRFTNSTEVDPKKLQIVATFINKEISTNSKLKLGTPKCERAARGIFSKHSRDNTFRTNATRVISTEVVPQNVTSVGIAIDCKFNNVDDGNLVQSIAEDELPGGNTTCECWERSNDSNTLQVEGGVFKKIQNLNKKKISEELSVNCRLDGEESPKNQSNPFDSCSKPKEKFMKDDGDKHLPLVKRARARMQLLPMEEKRLDEVSELDNGDRQASANALNNDCKLSRDDNSANVNSVDIRVCASILPSNDCILLKSNHAMKTCQFMGGSMDVEAALPPSKRLHRALEAMSANASEAGESYIIAPSISKMSVDGSINSSPISLVPADGILTCPKVIDLENQTNYHDVSNCDVEVIPTDASDAPADTPERRSIVMPKKCSPLVSNRCQHVDHVKVSSFTLDADLAINKLVETEVISENQESYIPEVCGHNSTGFCRNSTSSESLSSSTNAVKSLVQRNNKSLGVAERDSISLQELQLENISEEAVNLMKSGHDGNLSSNSGITMHSVAPVPLVGCFTAKSAKSGSTATSTNHIPMTMSQIDAETKQMPTPKDLSFSPDLTPMKVLIAAAQAKRLNSHSSSRVDHIADIRHSSERFLSPSPHFRVGSADRSHSHSEKTESISSRSPDINLPFKSYAQKMEINDYKSDSKLTDLQRTKNFSGHHEIGAAFKSFESLLCTLTRSKESISYATRRAIDCAKYGSANEVVQHIIIRLEKEVSLHRRVDIFFLIDSITRSCRGTAGDIFLSLFLPVLPRVISAVAPPGSAAAENRRQCLKVLRLWLERKTFPDSIIRNHIREIHSINGPSWNGEYSRRPRRTERAFDDPVREMEGMLVDEYGSNTNCHLPGLLTSCGINDDDDGSDADEKIFEAVTPERPLVPEEAESNLSTEKQRHALEDVDGELEMEDSTKCPVIAKNSSHDGGGSDQPQMLLYQSGQHASSPFAPPLPDERPPSPPPLPSSPPPLATLCLPKICQQPSTLNATASFSGANHLVGTNNNLSNPIIQSPERQHSNAMSEPTQCYGTGYQEAPKHLPSPVYSHTSCYYNNPWPNPSTWPGLDNVPVGNGTFAGKGYRIPPPPSITLNHFSYVQSESHPLASTARFGDDSSSGSCFSILSPRRLVQHDRCPLYSENIEARSNHSPCFGPPFDSTPNACHSWSQPPRSSSYAYGGHSSRPPRNSFPQLAGASADWIHH